MFRSGSVESSGQRTPPAYVPHPPYLPSRYFPSRRPPPQYCFDAARFACDASKPRYLDVERERLVTRWLAEANEALIRRERPPRYKPRSSDRRIDHSERRLNPEWSENFLLRRNGSEEDDTEELMTLKEFVDKFSLPRVVKVEGEDRPVLLYRVLEEYRRVEAVPLAGKKGKMVGKPMYIPDTYDGWFSACGCRGGPLATARGSVAAILRSRAPALVSPRALPAYRARHTETGRVGGQYEKAAARPGTPLRLAAVFADGSRSKSPKYAQLIDPHGNELFVPLNTKGELYEVCPDEVGASEEPSKATARAHRLTHLLALWPPPVRARLIAGTVPVEMAQDLGDDVLLRTAVTESVIVTCTLPDYGSTPSSPSKQVDLRSCGKETLRLLSLSTDLKVRRTILGFESEKKMFLSARLQKALTFCQLNVDSWIRQISYAATSPVTVKVKTAEEVIRDVHEPVKFEKERKFTLQSLKLDPTRLFGKSDKILKDIPDDTEGSIIFLSKNELEHMNYEAYCDEDMKEDKSDAKCESKNLHDSTSKTSTNESGQKKNKWFKNIKILKNVDKSTEDKIKVIENFEKLRNIKDPFDPLGEKQSSIERYQDMAKLIEDRFGVCRKKDNTNEKSHSYKSMTTSSSEMGTSLCSSSNKKSVLTKSVSVQTAMPGTEEPDIRIKCGRKNLSVDQIHYCGSMNSDGNSSRKLKSLDDSMLKKSSVTKSSCNLERRQRIQPDLIPEKITKESESYNRIQSCEEINMFGIATLYDDKEQPVNHRQNSIITEKLYTEFHVKSKKVLSKSTSNLLHIKKPNETKANANSNSMPTKTEKSGICHFRKKIDKPRAPTPKSESDEDIIEEDLLEESNAKTKRSISSIQKRKLPVIEDLPYGQVADAVRKKGEKLDLDNNSDNIYAEICTNGLKSSDEENYDSSDDVIANDPIIRSVKNEVIIRNDERARQLMEMQENPFRHIEVVVIEKTTDFNLDSSSVASSDLDELSRRNDVIMPIDSWDPENRFNAISDPNVHTIRLEITSNIDEIDNKSDDLEDIELFSRKDGGSSFRNSIHLNGTYPHEAIYDTLK